MQRYVALLRAVNVGGTGKLPMSDLRDLCTEAGFSEVRTYIASGNVVLTSPEAPETVQSILQRRLHDYAGKPVAVFVRTASQMRAILDNNPFPDAPPNQTAVVFLDQAPTPDACDQASGVDHEEIHLGDREIYVYYPKGMGQSKLRIPVAKLGTARNLNTVSKLIQMVADS
ncbi:MAG: DUF1697 domain-containing protein [Thermoanaerobaculia bacterium]|nr:DUF1697 domain-containing protein [Thermoanaerobaculia bacterium]